MADGLDILSPAVKITATEKLKDKLEAKSEYDIVLSNNKKVDFHYDDKESLVNDRFFLLFSDQIRETLEDFAKGSNTTFLSTIRLDLLDISTESVSKLELRQFFNQLKEKFIRDDLDDHFQEIRYIPEFEETDTAQVTSDDKRAAEYWIETIVPIFEDHGRKNTSESLENQKQETEKEEDKKKSRKDGDFPDFSGFIPPLGADAPNGGLTGDQQQVQRLRSDQVPQPQQVNTSEAVSQAASDEGVPLTNLDSQKIFYQEVVRETNIIVGQLLETYSTQELGLTQLPPEIVEIIRGQVQAEMAKNFDVFFPGGKLTIIGKEKLFRSAMRKLRSNPFFQVQLFQYIDTVALQKNVVVDLKKRDIAVDEVQYVSTRTEDGTTDEDSTENRYSKLQKEQFKKQLKEVLAFSVLTSSQSLESIADQIIDLYPQALGKGLDGIDDIDLENILQLRNDYQVNIEGKTKFKKLLDDYLRSHGERGERLQLFTSADGKARIKRELKEQLYNGLAGLTLNNRELDQTLDKLVNHFSNTRSFSQVNITELEKVLTDDIFISAQSSQEIKGAILEYLKTGELQHITNADYESVLKAAISQRGSGEAAFRSILRDFNFDGSDVDSTRLIKLLNAYALNNASAEDIEKYLGGMINGINPQFLKHPQLKEFIKQYVALHKNQTAELTGNYVVTYSDTNLNEDDLAAAVASTNALFKAYKEEVVALAYFSKELADWEKLEDAQLKQDYQDAWKLRQFLIREQERAFVELSNREKDEYAKKYGIEKQLFFTDKERKFDQQGYEDAIFNEILAHQAWNAPGDVQSLRDGSWLDKLRGVSKLRSKGLQTGAGKVLNFLKKNATPVLGAGAAGLGAGALASALANALGLVGNLAGFVTGAIGGALAGAAAGATFLGIGAIPGAIIGGIAGGLSGLLVSNGLAPSTAQVGRTILSNAVQPIANTAPAVTQAGADTLAKTMTASQATISNTVSWTAVSTPMVGTYLFSTMTIAMILSAFLPDASTTQVAPYFTLDAQESRYVTLKKTSNPINSDNPTVIRYRVEISKKADVEDVITIGTLTDTPAALDQNMTPVPPPTVPTSVTDQFTALQNQVLETGTPIIIEFDIDATDPRFANTLVTNDIKLDFKAGDVQEETISRAVTCIGDCPQAQVPPCWPSDGRVTQLPRAKGGPVAANNAQLSSGTSSHAAFNALLPNDAYDIGTGSWEYLPPIYAAAGGVVIFADWYNSSSVLPGTDDVLIDSDYGNLTIIDHGTFISYYAHQSQIGVSVGDQVAPGQLIGYVGSTGNSSGPHLHYEVRGLSEYVLYQTLHGDLGDPATPLCNEYYGNPN